MKTHKTFWAMAVILATLLLGGCHGDNESSTGEGKWNQMTWDQDKWS